MKTALLILLSVFTASTVCGQFSLLKDVNPGAGSNNGLFLQKLKSGLWVTSWNGGSLLGQEVWKTDGTTAGTNMIKDLSPGTGGGTGYSSDPHGTVMNHQYYYCGSEILNTVTGMYKTDGTSFGTILVSPVMPYTITRIDSTLFFGGGTVQNGVELYKSDGTAAGTALIKDIWPGPISGLRLNTNSTGPNFVKANGLVFFRATDSVHGCELWRTDGTTAGTKMVKDIFTGLNDGLTNDYQYITTIQYMLEWKGILYFVAQNNTNNGQLWRSDGTEAGTYQLTSYKAASFMPVASPLIQMGDHIYFVYKFSNGDTKLIGSDGTVAGTKEIISQNLNITSSFLAKGHSLFYFTASSAQTGNELWRSDGTAGGTFMVKDIYPGTGNGAFFLDYAKCLVSWNDIYFTGDNGQTGWELFHSDGSASNTGLVFDAYPGSTGSFPLAYSNVGYRLAVKLTTSITGEEEWISDSPVLFFNLLSFTGTPAGNSAKLLWETSSEENGVFFEIERSIDSLNFNKIGTVAGKGDNETKSAYTYNDIDLSTGIYYYRLKVFSAAGNYHYSEVVKIPVTIVATMPTDEFTVYGNPAAAGQIKVKVNALTANDELQVIDMLGRIILRQKIVPAGNAQIVTVNMSRNIASGSYFIRALINGKISPPVHLLIFW